MSFGTFFVYWRRQTKRTLYCCSRRNEKSSELEFLESKKQKEKMPPNNEEKPAKIDELMSEIDLTKPFLNTTSGEKYEIGKF